MNQGLVIAGGCTSSLIVSHLTIEKCIPYNDVDIFCFEQLNKKKLKVILKELHNEFRKLGLNFICMKKTENMYPVSERNIYKIANKTKTKINEYLYYRTLIESYNTFILTEELYQELNLDSSKSLFQQIKDDYKLQQLESQCIKYLQFTKVNFNHIPPTIDIATSILLNNFDISGCQTAIFQDMDGIIQVVGTYAFLYSLKIRKLIYNISEYTLAKLFRIRISKYAEKYKIDTLLPSNRIRRRKKFKKRDNFTVNALLLYHELLSMIIKDKKIINT